MRGLEAAMIEHCDGRIQMCAEFRSLTSKQMDSFYQALEFEKLKFSNNIDLHTTIAFRNRQNPNSHTVLAQIRKAENGSIVSVEVRLVNVKLKSLIMLKIR